MDIYCLYTIFKFYIYCLYINADCGGFVENKGGAITMMDMVEEFEPDIPFDCIWLFKMSHKNYNFQSEHLYIKVITLKDLGE